MKKLLVYGTLREGDYNFKRVQNLFGKDSIIKIDEKTLSGYAMFDLGAYPGLNKTDNEEHKVLFDVVEVTDEAFNFIQSMEIGAGYSPLEVDDAILYIYNINYAENKRIVSGDWLEHKKQTIRI